MNNLLPGFIFILSGVIILVGVIFEIGWFNYYRTKQVYKLLGKKGARVLYVVLAMILLFSGCWALNT